MKKHGYYFLLLLPILLLVAGSALADPKKAGPNHGAPKNVTECGTFLTEPGNYKLANDLLGCSDGGVWIAGSDITLNLKGHKISCANEIGEYSLAGIIVSPPGDPNPEDDDWGDVTFSNVTIKNGTVSNCHDGIVLVLTEDSKVMHITSTGNRRWEYAPGQFQYGTGITLWFSRNNVIMHNHTYGNAATGIGSWESSGNLFKHNTSTDNGYGSAGGEGSGIALDNEQNSRVMCNRVHGNADGILLFPGSSGNLLRGNLVTDNFGGILMLGLAWDGYLWQETPAGNTVRSNIVENNGRFDFYEFYFDVVTEDLLVHPENLCMNTWENNQFQTEFGPTGCFGIPVELDEKDVCALDDDDHDDDD
jgi:parallel beta-helix repeat protein